ncbi:hypothetical protein KKC22_17650, partial [Myxococcota bacterium]|nr:hypothetical protein [Myxococcota bacterium]
MKLTRNISLSLLAGLLLAVAGCNSSASFPYDQSLCGNEALDDNEPCDFDAQGNPMFSGAKLCHNLDGFAGGPVSCNSNCQINFSGCYPITNCSPYSGEGCNDDALTCHFYPESMETACTPHRSLPIGSFCDDSSQCMDQLMCVADPQGERFCASLCDVGTGCAGDTQCVDAGFPSPMGYCPRPQAACDPINNQMCADPTACYFFQNLEPRVQCTEPGASHSTEGEGCSTSQECNPTLTCFEDVCRRLCNLNTDCENGDFCQDVGLGFLDYGVCPTGQPGCDPVFGTGCPLGDEFCFFNSNNDGSTECAQSEWMPQGDPCGFNYECSPRMVCAMYMNDGLQFCRHLCNDGYPCDTGLSCGFATGFLPGVCFGEEACSP